MPVESVKLLNGVKSGAYIELQAVCLLDYGSTHGTYVGDRRLAANTEYILSNTEIITFGVRVTCGSGTFPSKSADDRTSLNAARSSKVTVADVGDAVTYPAKEFRVTFHRRAWKYVTESLK